MENKKEKPESSLSSTNWFPHDTDCTTDPKLNALIDDFGAAGYGIYWHIIELLHAEPTGYLPAKKYVYKSIAKTVKSDADTVERLVNNCLNDYDLFIKNEAHEFTSKRVQSNKNRKEYLIQIRKESASKGGKKSQANARANGRANANQTLEQTSSNSIANAKAKSSRGEERRYITDISPLIRTIDTALSTDDGSAFGERLLGAFASAYPRKLSESQSESVKLIFGGMDENQTVETLEALKADLELHGAESKIFADVTEYLNS